MPFVLSAILKTLKFTIITLLIVVAVKWILLIFPTHFTKSDTIEDNATVYVDKKTVTKTIVIDYSVLMPEAKKEIEEMDRDIGKFINEQLGQIEEEMIYGLDREDGFLDWIYGWGTGYRLVWNTLTGWVNDSDDAEELVKRKFHSFVVKYANISGKVILINDYITRRQNEFYVTVLDMVKHTTEKNLASVDFKFEEISTQYLPWGKYVMQGAIDVGATSIGLGAGTLGSKVIVSKLAAEKTGSAVIGKLGTMVGAKAASATVSIFIDISTLGIGILVDYLFSEGYEAMNRESEREKYMYIIHSVVHNQIGISLYRTRSELKGTVLHNVVKELNKTLRVKVAQ